MVNKHKGEVGFSHDGVDYTMRLGLNELCEIEDITGIKLANIEQELSEPSASLIRAVIWAGLRGGGHDIDLLATGDLISAFGLDAISEKMAEAFTASFPEGEDKKPENPMEAGKVGTGKSS